MAQSIKRRRKSFNFELFVPTQNVTLEGDIFHPSGLLRGGSHQGSSNLLRKLHALAEFESEISVQQNIRRNYLKLKQSVAVRRLIVRAMNHDEDKEINDT